MGGFETARAEAMKTCGPELQGDGYAMDTNGAFNNAKKNLESKMGFIDKNLGGVDKQFDKVTNALRSRGQSACGDVLTAVEHAYKGDIAIGTKAAPAAAPTKIATEPQKINNVQTAFNAYGKGTTDRIKAMEQAGQL